MTSLRFARALALVLALAACGAPQRSDPLAIANATLSTLHVPAAREGALANDSTWRVVIDRSGASPRLLLMQRVASLTIPDGPLELTAPLTYFRFEEQRWQQYHERPASTRLADATIGLLRADFSDTTRVQFYRIDALDIWSPTLDSAKVVQLVQNSVATMTREVARLMREGFLTMDAEP